MGPTTILRAELAEQFRSALECGRVVLFTAPCGFGKTTAARALREFADRRKSGDAARREVRGHLAWLDIALPQRGTVGLTDRIPAVFRLLTCREIELPPFSVTSTLPSVMNGGKDFSDWSRADDLLYQTLRRPVEAVLGRDGVGLVDLAMAELALGEEKAALLTLAPLESYYAVCGRHLDCLDRPERRQHRQA